MRYVIGAAFLGRMGYNGCMHINKASYCNMLSSFVSMAHMSMNSELLEQAVLYLRGTINKHVPATIVLQLRPSIP